MIKAKKSLGQNFLIDQNIIKKITNIINVKNKCILEIGPGTGNLTSKILENDPSKVLVIEKDNNLVKLLKNKFNTNIEIISKDVLKVREDTLSDKILTVYGNLPYNIATEILIKWILGISKKKSGLTIWF